MGRQVLQLRQVEFSRRREVCLLQYAGCSSALSKGVNTAAWKGLLNGLLFQVRSISVQANLLLSERNYSVLCIVLHSVVAGLLFFFIWDNSCESCHRSLKSLFSFGCYVPEEQHSAFQQPIYYVPSDQQHVHQGQCIRLSLIIVILSKKTRIEEA